MKETLGKRIAALRHRRGLRQDDIAQKLNLSAQAVSKWENDLTGPDISVLPELSRILGVTIDELLMGDEAGEVRAVKEGQKAFEDMILHIRMKTPESERVDIRLPMIIAQEAVKEAGKNTFSLEGPSGKGIESIDFGFVIQFAKRGVTGKMIEVQTDDGLTVGISVE